LHCRPGATGRLALVLRDSAILLVDDRDDNLLALRAVL